jgi:hypothetical protein
LVAIFATIYLVTSTNLDIRNRAFTGFEVNVSNFLGLNPGSNQDQASLEQFDPNPLSTIPEDPSSARYLYYKLASIYPGASTQNIVASGVSITGVASLAYDVAIDKTLIFITLRDLPYFEFTPLYFWLHNIDTNTYLQATSAEFLSENGTVVAYLVYSASGDLRTQYQQAVISYDVPGASAPVLPIITLTL